MEVGSQFLNCSGLPPVAQLKAANLGNAIFAFVCLVILLLLLAFIILYKAYKNTLQRLLILLTLSTAMSELDTISNVELQFDITPKVCMFIGFWDAWSSNLIEFFSFGFTVCLIATTYQQLRGKSFHFWRDWNCFMKHKVLLEGIYICATVVFPISYLWVPLYSETYGLGDTLCVMRTYDENCNLLNHSNVDSLSLQAVWLTIDIVVIISFLVLIVVFTLLIIKLKRSSKTINFSTIGRTIFLSVMLSISLIVRIGEFTVNLSIRIYHVSINNILYDAIDNPAYTFSNMVIPIGFAVYLYSPKKLKIKALRKAARKWICCRHNHSHHTGDCIVNDGSASAETSVVINNPSHTTFNRSLYTNEFTNITTPLIGEDADVPSYKTIHVDTT